ncbi:alpha/beta hydrolase fold domain-containing protein [Nocardia sp. NPDC046763]|uniref:alpha/beta hydrolase fold domain-containing protein n=1 Tax=Nocardia sp. NPDC046763 TaxID=3155256 RepID=UPI0033DB0FE1
METAFWRSISRLVGRWWFGPAPDWSRVRARVGAGTTFARAPRGIAVETSRLGGIPVETLTPRSAPTDAAVLYLHGSGYVIGMPRMVRTLTGALAAAMGTTVHALDYRLAPEHPYPAAIDDTLAAYRALLAAGIPAERIAVVGDSAGGGLALDLALRLREKNWPQPAILGLICPVLDLTVNSSAFQCDPSREPLLNPPLMTQFMDAYLPGVPEDERRARSPLYRDITGLPPIVMHSAGDDLLAGDARRFAAVAAKSAAPLRHREYRRLWHVFHALPMRVAREAVADLASALSERLYGRHVGHRASR